MSGWLVFSTTRNGRYEIYRSRPDGSSLSAVVTKASLDCWWPRVSYDGEWILYAQDTAGSGGSGAWSSTSTEVWVCRWDGSGHTELIDQASFYTTGVFNWSPTDHEFCVRIATSSSLATTSHIYRYTFDPATISIGAPTNVTANHRSVDANREIADPSYSPDKTKIVYSAKPVSGGDTINDFEIHRCNLDGTAETRLSTDAQADGDPEWAPDGSDWIVYEKWISLLPLPVGTWDVEKVKADATSTTKVLGDGGASVTECYSVPVWGSAAGVIYGHTWNRTDGEWRAFAVNPDGSGYGECAIGEAQYPIWTSGPTPVMVTSLASAADIDAQSRMDGTARRDETVRFDLLDKDLRRIDVLSADADHAPRVDFDTSRQILRTLSGLALPATELSVVDTLTTRVQPVAILESGVEFPLGVFMFGDASRALHTAYRPGGGVQVATRVMESELVDQSYILDQEMWRSLSFAVGTTLSAAIETVIDIAGVVAAEVEATSTQIREPISWALGQTTWLAVLKELHLMAGFTPPYFDNAGTYIGRTERTLALGQTPDFSYDMVDPIAGRIYLDTVIETDDLLQSPNRYMVIDNASTQAPIVGTYDVPDIAPHSIANRGFVIPVVETMQGLASQAAADAAAAAQAAQNRYSYRWVTFDAHPDYRHDGFNIVAFEGELYREQSWRIQLMDSSGKVSMHHSLRREYIAEEELGS